MKTTETKICPDCGETKFLHQFGWNYKDPNNIHLGVKKNCRLCTAAKRPGRAGYDELLEAQAGVCIYCKQPETALSRPIKSGNGRDGTRKVRRLIMKDGMLMCQKCNSSPTE